MPSADIYNYELWKNTLLDEKYTLFSMDLHSDIWQEISATETELRKTSKPKQDTDLERRQVS